MSLAIRISASGLLVLLALAASAAAPRSVVLRGHLDHPLAPQVEIAYAGLNVLTQQPLRHATALLDAQGNFRLVLPGLRQPTEASFRHGSETTLLFLTPGDDLRLTADAARFGQTIRYAGTGAAANNYQALSQRRFNLLRPDHPQRQIAKSAPAQMLAAAAAYRQQQRAAFAAYAARQPVPKAFRAYVRQRTDFEQANALLYYGQFHDSHPNLYPAGSLPATFYRFLKPLRPAQDSALALHMEQYYGYLAAYGPLPPTEPLPSSAALAASTQAQFGTSPSRDLVLAQYVYSQFNALDTPQMARLLAAFTPLNRDSLLARTLRARYAQALALRPGQPAPAFTLLDNAGKTVSLTDFKGKVVYLDFWGTWCTPCLKELPASLGLREKFADRDVAFVYVNVGDKEADWRQALATHQLPGPGSVLLRSPDNQVSAAYQVRGYPSYWLIGRDGRILDPTAPRPSDGAKTVAALERALAQP